MPRKRIIPLVRDTDGCLRPDKDFAPRSLAEMIIDPETGGPSYMHCCRRTLLTYVHDMWSGKSSPIPRKAKNSAVQLRGSTRPRYVVIPSLLVQQCGGALPC